MIGSTEILVVSGVVVLLFGATAIPKFAKSIGRARQEFNKGLNDTSDIEEELETEKTPPKNTKKQKKS